MSSRMPVCPHCEAKAGPHPDVSLRLVRGTRRRLTRLLLGVPVLALGSLAVVTGMTAVVQPPSPPGGPPPGIVTDVTPEERADRLEELARKERRTRIEALETGESVVITAREKQHATGDDSMTAWIQAQKLVERRLRSPGGGAWPTDGFLTSHNHSEFVVPRGDGVYDVRAWVDTPTGSGGSARTNFGAQVVRDPQGTWRLTRFQVY
jgi:hypothetical protein